MNFIILTPALTCPFLAKKEGYLDVLLLARTRKNISEELSTMTFSTWKNKKEKSLDKKDIEIVPFTSSDYHISPYVISTYRKRGLTKLIKARIKIQLKKGLYQLHNRERITDILRELKPPLRQKSPLSQDRCTRCSFFSKERVQLYHPFYVGEKEYLNIAHISDSHVAARMWMLEGRWNTNHHNVWSASSLSGEKPGEFSNFNEQFQHVLHTANKDKDIDIIIHTGDIIDYNRGYYNEHGENDLARDYYFNRNWLLFYELLLRHYEKPFFTVLGNHDYRLHPYPPNPVLLSKELWELFNMAPTVNLTRREMSFIHEDPHSLLKNIRKNHLRTALHSVRWYSLVMNPLLDYQIFYQNMAFMMLDWNRWEDHERGTPWAARVISRIQWNMFKRWHKKVVKRRKKRRIIAVVAMHPSVFNPFSELGDDLISTDPQTNIFYESTLVDTYQPQKDLVDGTFRLKRNEFIRFCLGNEEYGSNDYRILPEKGIDLILNGHAHRSGIFQVEGPHVYSRKLDTIKEGPLFCNAAACGPIGIKNDKGGPERIQPVPPGYHRIVIDGPISLTMEHSDLVHIREETRRDYGEVGQGPGFQVLDSVSEFLALNPEYTWQVQNLKNGSTITRIIITTGFRTEPSVTVTSVPLGWRHSVEKSGEFYTIACEAHDRGQGIFYEEIGEVRIKVEDHCTEKMGTLTVCWDMTDKLAPAVCVRVPGE